MNKDEKLELAQMIGEAVAENHTAQIQVIERGGKIAMPSTWNGWIILASALVAVIGFVSTAVFEYREHRKEFGLFRDLAFAHIKDEGIHQPPAVKKLATIETMQPIRDDIKDLKGDVADLKEAVQMLTEKLNEQP